MPFSYSGDPSDGGLNEVRFHLQDTDPTNAIFSDEEITYYVEKMSDVNGSVLQAASFLAEIAAAKFAREVSISSDQTSIALEQLQQKYEDLAARLRYLATRLETSGTGPIVGGNNADDWLYGMAGRKSFRLKIHDNNLAGNQTMVPDPWWIEYELGGFWTNTP